MYSKNSHPWFGCMYKIKARQIHAENTCHLQYTPTLGAGI